MEVAGLGMCGTCPDELRGLFQKDSGNHGFLCLGAAAFLSKRDVLRCAHDVCFPLVRKSSLNPDLNFN